MHFKIFVWFPALAHRSLMMELFKFLLFVKSFDVVYVLELIKKMVWVCFGMIWKQWEAIL